MKHTHEQLRAWCDEGAAAYAIYPHLGPLGVWRNLGRAYPEHGSATRIHWACFEAGYFGARDDNSAT